MRPQSLSASEGKNLRWAKGTQANLGGQGSCWAETAMNSEWRIANGKRLWPPTRGGCLRFQSRLKPAKVGWEFKVERCGLWVRCFFLWTGNPQLATFKVRLRFCREISTPLFPQAFAVTFGASLFLSVSFLLLNLRQPIRWNAKVSPNSWPVSFHLAPTGKHFFWFGF